MTDLERARALMEVVVANESSWGEGVALILAELQAERERTIKEVIAIFDKHASYDPHANALPGTIPNAIIYCDDELRADLKALKEVK